MSEEERRKNVVRIGLLQVLQLIRQGIRNGNHEAALDLLNDLIKQVEEHKEKDKKVLL